MLQQCCIYVLVVDFRLNHYPPLSDFSVCVQITIYDGKRLVEVPRAPVGRKNHYTTKSASKREKKPTNPATQMHHCTRFGKCLETVEENNTHPC